MTIAEAAKDYHTQRTACAQLAQAVKAQNTKEEEAKQALLAAMVDEGVKSVNLEHIGLFTMVTTSYLSVNADNKPMFLPYLKESGNGGLIKEDVNSRTLSAFLKEHLAELEKKARDSGADVVKAREDALAFLKQKGASYFTERNVAFKKA